MRGMMGKITVLDDDLEEIPFMQRYAAVLNIRSLDIMFAALHEIWWKEGKVEGNYSFALLMLEWKELY
jgi:hypothetical protein